MALRIYATLIALVSVGYIWEGLWWQEIINPGSVFGEPPQWFLHPLLVVTWMWSWHQWYVTRHKAWFVSSAFLTVAILNIPYLIHRNALYGAPLRTGLTVYWGLPFLLSSIVMTISSICVLILSTRKQYGVRVTALAIIMLSAFIRLRPFRPTAHIYDLIGPWGAGVVFVGAFLVFLLARDLLPGRHSATAATLSALGLYTVPGLLALMTVLYAGFPTEKLWAILLGGFHHPPAVLSGSALVLSAYSFDRTKSAGVAALLYAAVLYGCANMLMKEDAALSMHARLIACVACIAGAVVVSLVYKWMRGSIVANNE